MCFGMFLAGTAAIQRQVWSSMDAAHAWRYDLLACIITSSISLANDDRTAVVAAKLCTNIYVVEVTSHPHCAVVECNLLKQSKW